MNDLIVVGLHLASRQYKDDNHNAAMDTLRNRITGLLNDGTFPAGETDVLLAGDLNASRYDSDIENFWTGYDSGGLDYRTLSPEDGTDYPGTRLAGVPLYPNSQIDYLIASGTAGGLVDDLVQTIAHVHTELLPNDFTEFRRDASDHLPVTIRIRVRNDNDT